MFMFLLSLACLIWLHRVVARMMKDQVPDLVQRMERPARQA